MLIYISTSIFLYKCLLNIYVIEYFTIYYIIFSDLRPVTNVFFFCY